MKTICIIGASGRPGRHMVRHALERRGELPVRSRHAHDPSLASNLARRVDFALFMVEALEDDTLAREAPAVAGCRMPSAFTRRRATVAESA